MIKLFLLSLLTVQSFFLIGQTLTADLTSIDIDLYSGDKTAVNILVTNNSSTLKNAEIRLEDPFISLAPITYSKSNYGEYDKPANADQITDNVWITRGDTRGLFNLVQENEYQQSSPKDTEWAMGRTKDLKPGQYKSWVDAVSHNPPNSVNQDMSVHLIKDNLYFDVVFTSWTQGNNGGGFAYTRTPVHRWVRTSENIEFSGNEAKIIEVDIDASGMGTGEYSSNLTIMVGNENLTIPIQLSVTDAPGLALSAEMLNFGNIVHENNRAMELVVSNHGTEDLVISGVSLDSDVFSMEPVDVELTPGEKSIWEITFAPDAVAYYDAAILFNTNDPSSPSVTIELLGHGVDPPEVEIDTDTIFVEMFSGDKITYELDITNLSDYELNIPIQFYDNGINLGEVTFTKSDFADHTLPQNQDHLTNNVWITRANTQGIFNIKTEASFNRQTSPKDTEWAFGYSEELEPKDYFPWVQTVNSAPPSMVNQPMSMHLISEDLYYDVVFHSWTAGGNGGGFSYTRTNLSSWINSVELYMISANTSGFIPITIDAARLTAGNYNTEARLTVGGEVISIPFSLIITDAAGFVASSDSILFGNTFIGENKILQVTVQNKGSDDLLISNIANALNEFSVSKSSAGLNPSESEVFEVSFSPTEVAEFVDTLKFTTNDPSDPMYHVLLIGSGVEPPVISVDEDSVKADLVSYESATRQFTIHNTGESELIYSVTSELVSSPSNTWQLMISDPDDIAYGPDVKSVYGAATDSEILFRIELYEPFMQYNEQHIAIIIDEDSNPETGLDLSGFYNIEGGIEFLIGWNGESYELSEYNSTLDDWAFVDEASTLEFEPGSNEIVIGFPRDIFVTEQGFKFTVLVEEDWGPDEGANMAQFNFSPGWLGFDPENGVMEVNTSENIDVVFDATDLVGGKYVADIIVKSNDPLSPEVTIKAVLDVTGISRYAGPESLDFGIVYSGYEKILKLEFNNIGTDTLEISNVTSSSDDLLIETNGLSIKPFRSTEWTLGFTSTNLGSFTGSLSFNTNDPNNETVIIELHAQVFDAPVATLSEESVTLNVNVDEPESITVDLTNTGGGDLEFTIPAFSDRALNLNRESSIAYVPHNEVLNVEGGVTVSMWLYLEADPDCDSENNWRMIFNKSFAAGSGTGFDLVLEEDRSLSWSVGTEGGIGRYGGPILDLKKWINVTCTYNPETSRQRIYLDGVEVSGSGEQFADGSIVANFNYIEFGAYTTGCPTYGWGMFPGKMYDFRIWDHVRSTEQIKSDMIRPVAHDEAGLLANYVYSLETPNQLTDNSIHENHGFMDGVYWVPTTPFDWIEIAGSTGVLSASESELITIDLHGATAGNFKAELAVLSNDPLNPMLTLPINLELITGLNDQLDSRFTYGQNYPNPFWDQTILPYEVKEPGKILLTVWDASGKIAYQDKFSNNSPGAYEYILGAHLLDQGLYFYNFSDANASGNTVIHKMIVLK